MNPSSYQHKLLAIFCTLVFYLTGACSDSGQQFKNSTSEDTTCDTNHIEGETCTKQAPSIIASGRSHTCARLGNTNLKCWGRNDSHQLGLGNGKTKFFYSTPQEVTSLDTNVEIIVTGEDHTCTILVDKSVKCWGANGSGQLGLGRFRTFPNHNKLSVNLGSNATAIALAAGSKHTCAILHDGSVKCWGNNAYGQLGIGNSGLATSKNTPQLVNLGSNATAIALAAGSAHTCAILNDKSLKCWGRNSKGQLGLGHASLKTTPHPVNLGSNIKVIGIATGSLHTCAILSNKSNKSVKCWGQNHFGQLGIGKVNDYEPEPQPVNLGSNVVTPTAIATRRILYLYPIK